MNASEALANADESTRPQAVLLAVLLVVLLPTMLAAFFVGFQASDDANYLVGAIGWLEHFPYVGDSHWTLRHTITVPTALAIKLFGLNEVAVAATGMAYFTAFVCVNAWFAWRFIGPTAAVIATLMMLTLPGFPVVATYLSPDVPELFFVTSAFWLLRLALDDGPRVRYFVLAGLVAGLGYINRPTAAALPIFAVALWLVWPVVPRVRYLPMLIAFVAVVALDWGYLTAMTHQPFYRASIDLHHDVIDRAGEVDHVAREHRWIDREGNLSVNMWIDPVLALFVSQKYVLVFWLSLAAAVATWTAWRDAAFRTLTMIAGLGLVSFIFVAANPKLYLVPRYLLVAAWAATTVSAWWLASLWAARRRGWVTALVGASVGLALMALSIEDTAPRAVERALVRWVSTHPQQPIYTDVETRARSEFLFGFAHQPWTAVRDERPPAGALFFHNAARVEQCAGVVRCRDRGDDFRPKPGWTVVETIAGPRRPGATVISALGLADVLPPDLRRRILESASTVTVYRVR